MRPRVAKTYNRIAMYDFDGTLFRSWEATPEWWAGSSLDTGPYSFFVRPESLGEPCVPDSPDSDYWITKTVAAAKKDSSDRNVYVVVVTGRVRAHKRRVLELLKSKGITPEASYFNPGMSAAKFKVAVLRSLLAGHRGINAVDVWENENQTYYENALRQTAKALDRKIKVTIHSVHVPPKPLVCGPRDFGLMQDTSSVGRVVAKYQGKREVPTADGKGTSTVYEYGPGQVAKRHKEKAKRIEALRQKMTELRQQLHGDLTSKDPQTRLTALAICLMDETYERVGNEKSAEVGHHGVTNWLADHVSLGDKSATIKYTGKSGVKQEKTVTNARVLKALREAMKGKGKSDKILCDGEECDILAKDVNTYLKPFEVTAKDIRGLHANEEMRRRLREVRQGGPDLPVARKEKDKILKAEFQQALEDAAKEVGHEASTLRSQYLVPTMEDVFLHDGTVIEQLAKKAGGSRILYYIGKNKAQPQSKRVNHWKDRGQPEPDWVRPWLDAPVQKAVFLTSNPFDVATNHGVFGHVYAYDVPQWVIKEAKGLHRYDHATEVIIPDVLWKHVKFRGKSMDKQEFDQMIMEGQNERSFTQWNRNMGLRVKRKPELKNQPLSVTATKSEADKEEEEDQRLIRQSPKKKPPRRDLERGRVEDTHETDADEDQDRKDRSRNFKDAAAWIALRYAAGEAAAEAEDEGSSGGGVSGKFLQFLEEKGSDKMTNPDTGNKVKLKSLKGPRGKELQKREFKKWLDSESGGADAPSGGSSSSEPSKTKPKPKPKSPPADAKHAESLDTVEGARQKREDLVEEGEPFDVEAIKAAIRDEFSAITGVDPTTIKNTLGAMTLVAPKGSHDTPEMLLEAAVSSLTKANGGAIKAFDKKTKAVQKKALGQVTALGGAAAKGLDKSLSTSALLAVAAHMEEAKGAAVEAILDGRARKDARSKAQFAQKVLKRVDGDNPPSPKEIAEALVATRAVEVLDDPTMLYPERPLKSLSTEPMSFDGPESEAAYREKMTDAAVDAMYAYRTFPSEDREKHRKGLEDHIKEMTEGGDTESEQYAQAISQMRGMMLASALEDGDKAKGVNPTFQAMLLGADKAGRAEEFARVNLSGAAEGDSSAQEVFRDVLKNTSQEDLASMLPADHPAQTALKFLAGCPEGGDPNSQSCRELANLPQDSIKQMKMMINDAVMGEVLFTDQTLVSENPNASVKSIKKKKKQTKQKGRGKSFADMMVAFLASLKAGKRAAQLPTGVYDFDPWGAFISGQRE